MDSSAAKSIASRVGLGKVRHLKVKYFWIQDMVKTKRVQLRKVPGTENPADNLTKPKSRKEMETGGMLTKIGAQVVQRQKPRLCWADVVDDEGENGPWQM